MMDPIEAGVRRFRPAAPDDPGSDAELIRRLRDEIASTGPITFARFMERALYEPRLGYYRSAEPRPGREGDFLTAPEIHPIFGRAVARQLVEVWERLDRPRPFTIREYGAGTGALATAIVGGLEADASPLRRAHRYEPVEVDERRIAALRSRLEAAGRADVLDAPPLEPALAPITGAIIANEVLDALPVNQVEWRDGRLREVYVGWEGERFVELLGEPSTEALGRRLADEGTSLAQGQRAEIALGLDRWVEDAAAGLGRGVLLLIDYGHPAADLYGPARMAGTLRAYVRHRVHDDPYVNVGRQDLTAHVDLTAVERAARAVGLDPLGSTTQAEFLVGVGIDDVLEAVRSDPGTTLESYVALRSALARLLDPQVTGGFRVLAFGRGVAADPPLRGFGFRLPRPR